MKVKVEKRKSLCPICGEELVKLHYLGVRRIAKERGSPEYVGSFVDDLVDADGSVNWCEAHSGSYGYDTVNERGLVVNMRAYFE